MPRLTYEPSVSSRATRAASCSRVSATVSRPLRWCGRSSLDALLGAGVGLVDDDHPLDEHARSVDAVRVEVAGLDELLDAGDRQPARGGDERVEVACALVEYEVAQAVALPGMDEGDVGDDRLLQDVRAAA